MSDLLRHISAQGLFNGKAFAITDHDHDSFTPDESVGLFQWDRYHIENYLLDAEAISRVLVDLNLASQVDVRPGSIMNDLRDNASKTLDSLVRHSLEDWSSKRMVNCMSSSTDRSIPFDPAALHEAASRSAQKVIQLIETELSLSAVEEMAAARRAELEKDLGDLSWITKFRGRDILKSYLHNNLGGIVRYEVLRDLIVSKMRLLEIRPAGMQAVIDKISSA